MADPLAEVETAIIRCLAAAPHALGRRLRSELQLCTIFGLGRWQMRAVLENLVQHGLIARRRGSGTFVKQIPDEPAYAGSRVEVELDQLLVPPNEDEPITRMVRHHNARRLAMDLWSEWSSSHLSLQAILAGMIEHANRLRHILAANSILLPDGTAHTADQVIAAVNASDSNGAIFGYGFFANNREAFRACRKPIALHYPGPMAPCEWPSVSIDMDAAMAQAIHEFAAQGYRKVALLGLHSDSFAPPTERQTFNRTAEERGIQPAAFLKCDLQDGRSCSEAAQSLLNSDADCVFVTDDVVLAHISELLRTVQSRIGTSFGIITLSNRGVQLPAWCHWSKLELDGWLFGRMIVDALAIHIESERQRIPLMQVRLNWIPGSSHLRA